MLVGKTSQRKIDTKFADIYGVPFADFPWLSPSHCTQKIENAVMQKMAEMH